MPRRALPPPDPSIGRRIRDRRELRKWSIRHSASRAGVSPQTWMRAEKGQTRIDRYLLSEFAAVLECSVTDLTGQPYEPADRALEAAHARVPRVWRTLVDIAPDEPATRTAPPLTELAERADLLADRCFRQCDYAGAGQILPDLLADLHAATSGPDARAALSLMVKAIMQATFNLRHLGYVAEAAFAAERCRQFAEHLDEPVQLALADFTRAHAAIAGGSFPRALTLTTRAANELDRHTGAPTAPEMLGMLHLTAGLSVLADKDTDGALARVGEAERIAKRTGETTWMSFGPRRSRSTRPC